MKTMNLGRRLWPLAGAALLLMGTGCSIFPDENAGIHNVVVKEEQTPGYDLVEVVRTDVALTKKIYFKYSQTAEESYCFNIDGQRIVEVCVQTGDVVSVGDVLARLDVSQAESSLEDLYYNKEYTNLSLKQAKERMQYELERCGSEDEAARIRSSYEGTIQNYNDELTILDMRIEQMEGIVQNGEIRAGMSGVVSWVRAGILGKKSTAGDNVITVIDNTGCTFRTERNEVTDLLVAGSTVTLTRNDGSTYSGTILDKADSPDENYVYMALLEPDYELSVGVEASMIYTLDSRDDVLALPILTVHTIGDRHYVYCESEDGLKSVKYITIGMRGDNLYEITGGLSEGDIVIK